MLDVLWCTPTDITALNGHKYLEETARKITQYGLKNSAAEMIPHIYCDDIASYHR